MKRQHAVLVLLVAVLGLGCDVDSLAPPDDVAGDPVPVAVAITQREVSFGTIGSSVSLEAEVTDSSGLTIAELPIEWSVLGTGVARVNPSGLLTSIGTGTDTVRATVGSLFDLAEVRVSQVPVEVSVQSSFDTLSVILGTGLLEGAVVDSMGHAIPGKPVAWTSGDPSIVSVDQSGRVTAVSEGTASVEATSGSLGTSVFVTVRVTGPVGPSIVGNEAPCSSGMSASLFACSGIDLLSYLPIGAMGGGAGVKLNDLWGWTDQLSGKEYALVGRVNGIAFVDVSDPLRPVFVGQLPQTVGSPTAVWRDVKVYDDHAYIVADGSGSHGMQVFDLRELRTGGEVPATFLEMARYTGIGSAHNIAINEATGFAYVVGASGGSQTCGGGLHIVDIRDPRQPVFAGCFADPLTGFAGTGYTHDAVCIQYDGPDTDYQGNEICFGLNENALSIADVTDKASPVAITRASYPNVGYAHQGWVTEDRRYLYSDDELDEFQEGVTRSRTMIWDIADLDDPVLAAEYLGPTGATDHNLYVHGTRLYQSNYQLGIRVLDISDPLTPTEMGFFDTSPASPNAPGFDGSWSNYPFFESGIIVVTSWEEGLFVLRLAN